MAHHESQSRAPAPVPKRRLVEGGFGIVQRLSRFMASRYWWKKLRFHFGLDCALAFTVLIAGSVCQQIHGLVASCAMPPHIAATVQPHQPPPGMCALPPAAVLLLRLFPIWHAPG